MAGTAAGVTALQMDIKIEGLTPQILKEALSQAKIGRMHILENMNQMISEPRKEVGQYAPKLHKLQVPVDKIREIIGPGGKMINQIIADCDNVKIDIEDDGRVVIYHHNREAIDKAVQRIESLVKSAKVGEIFDGKVVRIEKFGAFVSLFPGTDGLLHVSKISYDRVEKVEDVLKLGDIIKVIVTEVDEKGRVNVSAKDLLPKPEGYVEPERKPFNKDKRPPRRNG